MFIWAHRGASGDYPENTLLAFEQAIAQGADGIELDIIQVQDELYIWHDRYLPEHLGNELLLSEQDKEFVESIQLPQNQKIPTLSEVLTLVSGRVTLNIELKYIEDLTLLLHALQAAEYRHGFTPEQLLVSSFNHHLLEELHLDSPHYPLGILVASSANSVSVLAEKLKPYSIHFSMDCLLPEDVDTAHKMGLKSFVYTVDREKDLDTCKNFGVDGVFTNFPAQSREILDVI